MTQSQITQTFAANVKSCRKVNGLTQESFSKLMGVTRSSVGSWEEGRCLPAMEVTLKVAAFFGKDLTQMLTCVIPNGSML